MPGLSWRLPIESALWFCKRKKIENCSGGRGRKRRPENWRKENWKLPWRKRKEKEARELASQHLRRRCGAKSTSLKPLLINCNHWEPLLFFSYLTAFQPFEEIEQFSMSLLEDNITSCILPNRKNHTKSPFLLPFRMYTGCMCAGICISICMVSFVQLFATPWTVAHQVPLSMEFSSQKYWSG